MRSPAEAGTGGLTDLKEKEVSHAIAEANRLSSTNAQEDFVRAFCRVAWQHNGVAGAMPPHCIISAKNLSTWVRCVVDTPMEKPLWFSAANKALADQVSALGENKDGPGDYRIAVNRGNCIVGQAKRNGKWETVAKTNKMVAKNPGKVPPLYYIVRAWLLTEGMKSVRPHRYDHGILPNPFAEPSLVGESLMPGLIAGLYGTAGGHRTGRVNIEERIVVELLMSVPRKHRQKLTAVAFRFPLLIREIVEDWLVWNPQHYRPSSKTSGKLLATALDTIHEIKIRLGPEGGFVRPITVQYVTSMSLDGEVGFMVMLPPGSQVGPGVDRKRLREFGNDAPAWRALLNLYCLWNRVGGHNGKLIRPTRPVALRDPQGRLIDEKGNMILDRGRPVWSALHSRAVHTGERELNPDRNRYPAQNVKEIRNNSYPLQTLPSNPASIRSCDLRARKAHERLEAKGAAYIERMGESGNRLPWRIMPPDTTYSPHAKK